MTDWTASGTFAEESPDQPRRPRGRGLTIVLSQRTLTDVACFVFFLWSSTALRSFLPSFFAYERYLWAVSDTLVIAWVVIMPGRAIGIARRHVIVALWGVIAPLSMIWSWDPEQSLYFGLQLLFTILMGFFLCSLKSRTRLMQLLFLSLLPAQVFSFYINHFAPYLASGYPGGGAFTHKNVLGNMMLLEIITSLCLLLQGWRPVLTTTGFLAAWVLLVQSHSATSLLIAVLIVAGLVPLAMLYRSNLALTRAVVGAGFVILALFLLVILITGFDPIEAVLGSVGKDETLTGRTVLWGFGWEAFKQYPWFGEGYRGYWLTDKTTVLLLRYVMQQDLEIFHNNFIEVAVAFGIWGPLLLILGLVAGSFKAAKEFFATKSLSALWSLLFMLFIITYCFAENPLFANHGILQVLFVIAVAARDPPRATDAEGPFRGTEGKEQG
jgi:exopolysaccharide production protein ExoQ